jgi:tRNA(fMet)-specific endonuclease VapC
MFLLDTDTFTHYNSGNPRIARHREELSAPEIKITIITKIEVLQGRFEFLLKAASTDEFFRAQNLLLQTEAMLSEFPIVFLDQSALANFNRLRFVKGLKKIGRADLLIAGIALAQNAALVTRNVKDFARIPDLQIVNWLD